MLDVDSRSDSYESFFWVTSHVSPELLSHVTTGLNCNCHAFVVMAMPQIFTMTMTMWSQNGLKTIATKYHEGWTKPPAIQRA